MQTKTRDIKKLLDDASVELEAWLESKITDPLSDLPRKLKNADLSNIRLAPAKDILNAVNRLKAMDAGATNAN
jgi:phage gp36-like protein